MHPTPTALPAPTRDTAAWQFQSWASFLIAAVLCGTGLASLPGRELERAFMLMAYLFCLTAAFVLAKFIRDAHEARRRGRALDTPMFGWVAWGGFALAMMLTGWGLLQMEISQTYKAFLVVSWLYLITCTFTLAKTLRDRHEADLAEARAQGRAQAVVALREANGAD